MAASTTPLAGFGQLPWTSLACWSICSKYSKTIRFLTASGA
jgi:hypothetical protein